MSAMENMLRTMMAAAGVDVESVKSEIVKRVGQFEQNVETLNNTLINHHARLARLETMLEALLALHNLPIPPAAQTVETANVNGPRSLISPAA